jgi:hypothetical protein
VDRIKLPQVKDQCNGSFDYDNDLYGSIKGGKCIDHLSRTLLQEIL